MDKLIHKLVEVNISKGKISNEEGEIFTYGYRLLVEKILIFLISIFVAALCDAFFEKVIVKPSYVITVFSFALLVGIIISTVCYKSKV